MAKAKAVGYWLMEVSESLDLSKYGLSGGSEHPFGSMDAAVEFHKGFPYDPAVRWYILELFSNGQMKTHEL